MQINRGLEEQALGVASTYESQNDTVDSPSREQTVLMQKLRPEKLSASSKQKHVTLTETWARALPASPLLVVAESF